MLLLVAALALLVPQASRWKEIGYTSSGNPVFVDSRTVRKAADGIITATVRVVYGKPVKVGDVQLTSSRAIAMFNCTTSRFAVRENTLFIDEKSNRIYQKKTNKIPGYGPTLEGNFADVAIKHLCAPRDRG